MFGLLYTFFFAFSVFIWSDELNIDLGFAPLNRLSQTLNALNGKFQDYKFHIRGKSTPKNPIVLVSIDNESLEKFGRWPWDRKLTSELIKLLSKNNPSSIGVDIVFSEKQTLLSDTLLDYYRENNLDACLVTPLGGDELLAASILRNPGKIVLSWISSSVCFGKNFDNASTCHDQKIVTNSKDVSLQDFKKFAYVPVEEVDQKIIANLASQYDLTPNVKDLSDIADFQASANVYRDVDGVLRKSFLGFQLNSDIHLSLAAQMFLLNDNAAMSAKRKRELERLFQQQAAGMLRINWRGPSETFTHIPAWKILGGQVLVSDLKEHHIILGVTALAAHDVGVSPFDSQFVGPEVHATILDNLLSNDFYRVFPSTLIGLIVILFLVGFLSYGIFKISESLNAQNRIFVIPVSFGALLLFDTIAFINNLYFPSLPFWLYFTLFFALKFVYSFLIESQKKLLLAASFSRYVAPEIVQDLLKNPYDSMKGTKRDLSLLFSDIRGFTTFSEKLDPIQLTSFLNEYFTLMLAAIQKEGGTLDKFIGDAIMCFWNAPVLRKDHASRALRCGFEMLKVLKRERSRLEQKYGVPLEVGIGINTGLVFVGNVGSESSLNYTALGDDVNLASRLESLTKEYGSNLLIGQSTFEALKLELKPDDPLFLHIRLVDRVKVKGKLLGISVYELLENPILSEDRKILEKIQTHYFKGDFLQAKQELGHLKTLDPLFVTLTKRCEYLLQNPPEDWDGIWTMKSK